MMRTTIPVWIRPGTVIYTVRSMFAEAYPDIKVQYKLESGGDGWFTVDPDTGDVVIVGRHQFVLGEKFTLAVSAQCVGANPREDETPAQELEVIVGSTTPQFYSSGYHISMPETTPAGGQYVLSTILNVIVLL